MNEGEVAGSFHLAILGSNKVIGCLRELTQEISMKKAAERKQGTDLFRSLRI